MDSLPRRHVLSFCTTFATTFVRGGSVCPFFRNKTCLNDQMLGRLARRPLVSFTGLQRRLFLLAEAAIPNPNGEQTPEGGGVSNPRQVNPINAKRHLRISSSASKKHRKEVVHDEKRTIFLWNTRKVPEFRSRSKILFLELLDPAAALLISGLIIGYIGGLTGSLFGMGGAFVMVPLMVSWTRLSQHEAHGTSLLGVLLNGVVGAFAYGKNVHSAFALVISLVAMVTSRSGALASRTLPPHILKKYFGLALVFSAPVVLLKAFLSPTSTLPVAGGTSIHAMLSTIVSYPARTAVLSLVGAISGFLSGLLGIGSGTIIVPAMVLLGSAQQAAQGTSLLSMTGPALVGALTHLGLGHVRLDIAPAMLLGIYFGSQVGGSMALMLPERMMKLLFSFIMVYFGLRYMKSSKSVAVEEKSVSTQPQETVNSPSTEETDSEQQPQQTISPSTEAGSPKGQLKD
mmetsp:Transcript_18679/g.30693  ORF Transcript_18679/g.30693 Transcript_18679/m.30693 type:complete len:457 (-) Transcript_18679:686-2056(-)